MSEYNDNLAERIRAENDRRQLAQIEPKPINPSPVNEARYIWMIGTIGLDLATAYYISQITIIFYGVLWFLIGAGGLIWAERQRERIGNNKTQESIGGLGVIVSAGAVVVMAILAGAVYLTGMTNVQWVKITVEVVTVSLFAYHLIQAYRYQINDDIYKEINQDSRDEALTVRDIRQVHRAARYVESMQTKVDIESGYRGQYGAAFDAAYQSTVPAVQLANPTPPQSQQEQ